MVESYKSGFEPPGDVEFEDYGQAMKRTASDTSLSNSREGKEKPAGKSKGKLWPFIKNKNKVTHECSLNKESHLHWKTQQSLTGCSEFHFAHLDVTWHFGEFFMGWDGGQEGYNRSYYFMLVMSCDTVAIEIYLFNVTFVVSVTLLCYVVMVFNLV